MISKRRSAVNTLLRSVAVMVLCTGFSYSQNSRAETDSISDSSTHLELKSSSRSNAKAQLHVPWNLLSERLKTLVNEQAPGTAQKIEAQSLNVQEIVWQLDSGAATAALLVDTSSVNASGIEIGVKKANLEVDLNQITVDQVIERVIGGVRVRVHLNAVCGPIQIKQESATAKASFTIDWKTGSPVAALSKLDLGWDPNSWTFNDFTCTGPSGLDTELREGIANYLRDPATFKPYLETYIAENLKTQVDAALAQLRSPLKVGTGSESVALTVGELSSVSTGLIADITLTRASKSVPQPSPSPAKSLPNEKSLARLSTSEPSLIGDIDLIEFVIQQKLRSQGEYYRINLQEIAGFHKLMHSRISQLFVWADLLKYPEDNPFYLNLANPKSLSLKKGSGSNLTASVPIYAISQSYREKKWWSWVVTKGSAKTSVALSLSRGRLKYETEISSATLKSAYGAAYYKEFDKDAGNKIPDKIFAEAIAGPQSALSGTFEFPIVDLGSIGEFRAESLSWLDNDNFRLTFKKLN